MTGHNDPDDFSEYTDSDRSSNLDAGGLASYVSGLFALEFTNPLRRDSGAIIGSGLGFPLVKPTSPVKIMRLVITTVGGVLSALAAVAVGSAILTTGRWKLFAGALVADIVLTAATPLMFGPGGTIQAAVELLGVVGPPLAVVGGIWLQRTNPKAAEWAADRLTYTDHGGPSLSEIQTPSRWEEAALTAEEIANLDDDELRTHFRDPGSSPAAFYSKLTVYRRDWPS